MKLPWDSKYVKISFHLIITIIAIYILKLFVDFLAFAFVNFGASLHSVGTAIFSVLALFSPLVIALIIAYLLDSVVGFYQRHYDSLFENKIQPFLKNFDLYNKYLSKKQEKSKYKKRYMGSTLAYLSIVVVITFIISVFLVNLGGDDTGSLIGNFNVMVASLIQRFDEFYTSFEVTLEKWGVLDHLSVYIDQLIDAIGRLLESVTTGLVNILTSIGSGIINFFIALVIAFYFMVNKQFMREKTLDVMEVFIPAKQNKMIKNVCGDVHGVFYHYIQGTLIDATIMAFLLGGWLAILGVNFAILIGVISGFSNIIPYVGAIVGFVLAVVTALISGDPMTAVWAAVGILIIQQIDGIFIQPKVVGVSVKISPVLVLLSLSIGGSLFGLLGMVFAVPTCAIIKLFAERYFAIKKEEKELKESKQIEKIT